MPNSEYLPAARPSAIRSGGWARWAASGAARAGGAMAAGGRGAHADSCRSSRMMAATLPETPNCADRISDPPSSSGSPPRYKPWIPSRLNTSLPTWGRRRVGQRGGAVQGGARGAPKELRAEAAKVAGLTPSIVLFKSDGIACIRVLMVSSGCGDRRDRLSGPSAQRNATERGGGQCDGRAAASDLPDHHRGQPVRRARRECDGELHDSWCTFGRRPVAGRPSQPRATPADGPPLMWVGGPASRTACALAGEQASLSPPSEAPVRRRAAGSRQPTKVIPSAVGWWPLVHPRAAPRGGANHGANPPLRAGARVGSNSRDPIFF